MLHRGSKALGLVFLKYVWLLSVSVNSWSSCRAVFSRVLLSLLFLNCFVKSFSHLVVGTEVTLFYFSF